MKDKYVVWGVVDSDKELDIDRTSFYADKETAFSAANLRNEHVCEKNKPFKVKKFYLSPWNGLT